MSIKMGIFFTFETNSIGCSITLIDNNGDIVYTGIVCEDGIVEIPTDIVGFYDLQLVRGGIVFVGKIEL